MLLLCKHEDLSIIPSIHCVVKLRIGAHAHSPSTGEVETRGSVGLTAMAGLAKLVNCRIGRSPISDEQQSKTKGGWYLWNDI